MLAPEISGNGRNNGRMTVQVDVQMETLLGDDRGETPEEYPRADQM